MKLRRANSGFTLIELSIVLVIIGLIVGGVLVGRDLIHAAEIRHIITQRDQFEAAVNTFIGKYNCIPGDCDHAYAVGVGSPPGSYGENGDGDDIIGYTVNNVNEMANFWYHLSQSKLINWTFDPNYSAAVFNMACYDALQSTISSPCLSGPFASLGGYRGGWWVFNPLNLGCNNYGPLQTSNYWWLAANMTDIADGGLSNGDAAIFSPVDAYAIDGKIDDGLPLSGVVLAVSDGLNDCESPSPASGGGCTINTVTPNVYDGKQKDVACGLIIRTSF